jgi:hypothetical protein
MNEPIPDLRSDRALARLHAYHDGELSGFARWRFERRLRRSPALQRELAELARIGDWVRASHGDPPAAELWDRIAMRLPAIDAQRAEAGAGGGRAGLRWWAWPGAVASAVVVAALAFQWLSPPPVPKKIGVVRWLDSGPRDVMLLQASPDTTVVWVIGAPRLPRGQNDKL